MVLPTIRTITLGIEHPHPLNGSVLERAVEILRRASEYYREQGYKIQTVRLSTRPLLDDLQGWSAKAIQKYALKLQRLLNGLGVENCSLGTVFACRPDFALERLDLIADLLIGTTALNATVHLATPEDGLRSAAALPVARIMQRLAYETIEGFGNFRFAMLACVPPGGPFFPASYHTGPSRLSLGLQGAPLVLEAIEAARNVKDVEVLSPDDITTSVRNIFNKHATPIAEIGQRCAQELNVQFGGLDLSPAPMGKHSIVAALEACGYGLLGTTGMLTVVAALTTALKSVSVPTCGFNGLMLPVLEDRLLGQRWEEGRVNAHQLLLYSAVCGTGLDTIPLPGECPVEEIAHLLMDVATLALRYQKPLSARLFPVPGKRAGERTQFSSPYLTNTTVAPYMS